MSSQPPAAGAAAAVVKQQGIAALVDCEQKLAALAAAMAAGIEACADPPSQLPVSLAEAAALDGARIRLRSYETAERARLAPVASRVNGAFRDMGLALQQLVDAPMAVVLQHVAQLEAEERQLDAQLATLYAEAAELDDRIQHRIEHTALEAFALVDDNDPS